MQEADAFDENRVAPEPLQPPSQTQVGPAPDLAPDLAPDFGSDRDPSRTPCRDAHPDANRPSATHFLVPTQPAVRLGLRMVRGLDAADAERVVSAVARHGAFTSIRDLFDASGVSIAALRRLAAADAFRSMGLDRQQASWQILALRDRDRPLWTLGDAAEPGADAEAHEPRLPVVSGLAAIRRDLEATGVSGRGHPLGCLRGRLQRAGAIPCGFLREVSRTPAGRRVVVAGLVLVRQRPMTAKGIVFMTIEDETGIANLILRPRIYERLRKSIRHAQVLLVRGRVERKDGVVHVLVGAAKDIASAFGDGGGRALARSRDFH